MSENINEVLVEENTESVIIHEEETMEDNTPTEEVIFPETPEFYNKHYITIDEHNRIVNGFSDAFGSPTETDICINEQGGYQFRLFPDGEENPVLLDWNGMIPLYKYEDGEVVKRSEEELEADRAEIPTPEPVPTMDERVTALEEQMVMADNTAIELFEAQLAQEEINAAQDVALIEIYEMMGGE